MHARTLYDLIEYSMNITDDMTAKTRVLVKCLYKDSFMAFLKQKKHPCKYVVPFPQHSVPTVGLKIREHSVYQAVEKIILCRVRQYVNLQQPIQNT